MDPLSKVPVSPPHTEEIAKNYPSDKSFSNSMFGTRKIPEMTRSMGKMFPQKSHEPGS
jgi:hypothetical protein